MSHPKKIKGFKTKGQKGKTIQSVLPLQSSTSSKRVVTVEETKLEVVPIRISVASDVKTRNSIISFKQEKKAGKGTSMIALVSDALLPEIIQSIDDDLLNRHFSGEIDLMDEIF